MMAYYATNSSGAILSGIPGLLTYPPYYWWEAGAMFGQMIEYWYYTNDTTYNDIVTAGLLFQVGPQANYVRSNKSERKFSAYTNCRCLRISLRTR